jgi:hypothetical protein
MKTKQLENPELYYKEVYFDLPNLILVNDGFRDQTLEEWAEAHSKNEKLPYSPYAPPPNEPGYLSIGGGFPVYIPKEIKKKAYVVNLLEQNLKVGLQFLRRINQKSTTKLCGEVIGDRTGRASFSSVKVNFDLKQIKKEFHNKTNVFVELSVEAVNLFLENYRSINNRPYISKITPQIIQTFLIFNRFTNGETKTQTYGSLSGPLVGLGSNISNEQDSLLRKKLEKGDIPLIVDSLELEIKNKLDLRDWRLAAVDSAVLFETWLKIFIREQFELKSLSKDEIDGKFHKNDKYKTPHSTFHLAKTVIKKCSGFDFFNTDKFKNWSKKTRGLRNNIIHGNQYKVNEKEARESFNSVIESIELIKKALV